MSQMGKGGSLLNNFKKMVNFRPLFRPLLVARFGNFSTNPNFNVDSPTISTNKPTFGV